MVKLEYTPNDTFLGHLEVRKQSIWHQVGGWVSGYYFQQIMALHCPINQIKIDV